VLVLARKIGESIVLGNNIRVKIVEISSGVVRLGIEAPREVSIVRSELHSRVEGENRRSAAGAGPAAAPPSGVLGALRKKTEGPQPPAGEAAATGTPVAPESAASPPDEHPKP
jgi:carbon storage regulator